MLGYISSTRKKSCRQCVKAKRRCDLGYPCCKRCFAKALDCTYPNASVREAEVILRQTTPDLLPPATCAATTIPTSTAFSAAAIDFGTTAPAVVPVRDDPAREWNDGFAVCQRIGAGIGAAEAQADANYSEFEGAFGLDMVGVDLDPALLQSSSDSSASGCSPAENLEIEIWPMLGSNDSGIDEGDSVEQVHEQRVSKRPRSSPVAQTFLPGPILRGSDRAGEGESGEQMHDRRNKRLRARVDSPSRTLMPPIWCPTYLNDSQTLFLVSGLCSFVPTLAYSGHNAFIHPRLYETQQATAYQDACALSALYAAKTTNNIPVLARSIEAKIAALIATSHAWTLEEHLAAVQALVVYQCIRLFDPTLNLQTSAVPHNALLALWTAHLWKRSFTNPLSLISCHASWVFYESLRRTALISVVVRAAWTCVTQGGLCDQVHVLARLPLTTDDVLWTEDKEAFETRTECKRKAEVLVAYGDWSSKWKAGQDDPEKLSDFQRLLLVACRGKEDRRLLYKNGVRIG